MEDLIAHWLSNTTKGIKKNYQKLLRLILQQICQTWRSLIASRQSPAALSIHSLARSVSWANTTPPRELILTKPSTRIRRKSIILFFTLTYNLSWKLWINLLRLKLRIRIRRSQQNSLSWNLEWDWKIRGRSWIFQQNWLKRCYWSSPKLKLRVIRYRSISKRRSCNY